MTLIAQQPLAAQYSLTAPFRDALCGLEYAHQVRRAIRIARLFLTMLLHPRQLFEYDLLPLIPTQESAAREQFVSVSTAGPYSSGEQSSLSIICAEHAGCQRLRGHQIILALKIETLLAEPLWYSCAAIGDVDGGQCAFLIFTILPVRGGLCSRKR